MPVYIWMGQEIKTKTFSRHEIHSPFSCIILLWLVVGCVGKSSFSIPYSEDFVLDEHYIVYTTHEYHRHFKLSHYFLSLEPWPIIQFPLNSIFSTEQKSLCLICVLVCLFLYIVQNWNKNIFVAVLYIFFLLGCIWVITAGTPNVLQRKLCHNHAHYWQSIGVHTKLFKHSFICLFSLVLTNIIKFINTLTTMHNFPFSNEIIKKVKIKFYRKYTNNTKSLILEKTLFIKKVLLKQKTEKKNTN